MDQYGNTEMQLKGSNRKLNMLAHLPVYYWSVGTLHIQMTKIKTHKFFPSAISMKKTGFGEVRDK